MTRDELISRIKAAAVCPSGKPELLSELMIAALTASIVTLVTWLEEEKCLKRFAYADCYEPGPLRRARFWVWCRRAAAAGLYEKGVPVDRVTVLDHATRLYEGALAVGRRVTVTEFAAYQAALP